MNRRVGVWEYRSNGVTGRLGDEETWRRRDLETAGRPAQKYHIYLFCEFRRKTKCNTNYPFVTPLQQNEP